MQTRPTIDEIVDTGRYLTIDLNYVTEDHEEEKCNSEDCKRVATAYYHFSHECVKVSPLPICEDKYQAWVGWLGTMGEPPWNYTCGDCGQRLKDQTAKVVRK